MYSYFIPFYASIVNKVFIVMIMRRRLRGRPKQHIAHKTLTYESKSWFFFARGKASIIRTRRNDGILSVGYIESGRNNTDNRWSGLLNIMMSFEINIIRIWQKVRSIRKAEQKATTTGTNEKACRNFSTILRKNAVKIVPFLDAKCWKCNAESVL